MDPTSPRNQKLLTLTFQWCSCVKDLTKEFFSGYRPKLLVWKLPPCSVSHCPCVRSKGGPSKGEL